MLLDVVGLIPGAAAPADLINGLISAARGDLIGAGLSLFGVVPIAGEAATVAKIAAKSEKYLQALEVVAKKVMPHLPARLQRTLQDAIDAAKKKIEEIAGKNKPAPASSPAPAAGGGKGDGGKVKGNTGGPCDHLRRGKGTGPYRGGAHGQTSKPKNDGKDSHHMPADDVSPLPRNDGPAIQMDPTDHRMTRSNGSVPGSALYRQKIEALLKAGKWREAMLKEIHDIRRIQGIINDPRKYNEAMLEMLEYFKCLEKNGLLPSGRSSQ
jgi:hypothetical protein